ncbi:Recombination-associated protein RdgC [Gammaproteobacteria bacterium]
MRPLHSLRGIPAVLFKNLYLFRLVKPFDLTPEQLDEHLAKVPFRPCGPLEMGTLGFVPPLGKTARVLVHANGGRMMLCVRSEEKLLPGSVVREMVAEKVAEIEEEQMRKVSRKERDNLKDEVLQDLLPRAFTRSRTTYLYLDPQLHYLIVDNSSPKRAEEITVLLRKCLGSLEILPPQVNTSPSVVMTQWLLGQDIPPGFVVEEQCELRTPGEQGSQVRLDRQDLGAEEVRAHVDAGKRVVKLALTWEDRLSLVFDESLMVRRLRFLDIDQDTAVGQQAPPSSPPLPGAAGSGNAEAERFDADFTLMSLEIAKLLPALFAACGGEAPPADK